MIRTRRRWLLAAVALAVVLSVAGAAVQTPADRVLVVADADTGERLATVPVDDGTTVTLAYTHSVEKTPVRDVYAVDGTRLDMVRMEFDSYGAGLPSTAEVERSGNGSFVTRPDRSTAELYVAPGAVANHTLVVGDDRYDLVALSGGETVVLSVERRTAGDLRQDHSTMSTDTELHDVDRH